MVPGVLQGAKRVASGWYELTVTVFDPVAAVVSIADSLGWKAIRIESSDDEEGSLGAGDVVFVKRQDWNTDLPYQKAENKICELIKSIQPQCKVEDYKVAYIWNDSRKKDWLGLLGGVS